MRTTRQLSITLPNEMADALRARVQSGEYASESEAIRDGLRALFARDRAVEQWLHNEVGAAYDALIADPARAVTVDHVRERLAAEHSTQQGCTRSSSPPKPKINSLTCTGTSLE